MGLVVCSLDFDPASVQPAKSSFNVPPGFKYCLSFGIPTVKFSDEIRVGRIQELGVIPFVQVQDELTDVLEAHLRPAFEKGNDFRLRVRFVLAYSLSFGCDLSVIGCFAQAGG